MSRLSGCQDILTSLKTLVLLQSMTPKDNISPVIEKILSLKELPTYQESMKLLEYFCENFEEWIKFGDQHVFYMIWTQEFIDQLAREIKKLGNPRMIEVCAGKGKLSYQLNKKGLNLIPTDDYSWNLSNNHPDLVETITAHDALKKYNPRLVIGSWIPSETRIGFDVLNHPSVEYFIDIGEHPSSKVTWMTEECLRRKDFSITTLDKVAKYCLSREDSLEGLLKGESDCKVTLFSKIKM